MKRGLVCAALLAAGCQNCSPGAAGAPSEPLPACILETNGDFGPAGSVAVDVDTVASGLEVPWGLAFLPGGDLLITERGGRVRLLRAGQLEAAPVAVVTVVTRSEDGLLGIALHPADPTLVYLYSTQSGGNQVDRWKLAADHRSATYDKLIFQGIAAAPFHDGGRIHFGTDGMLYVGTGDARDPARSQDPASPNGKILRLTPEGAVPGDNPTPGSPVFVSGIRNTQGFDWLDAKTLVVMDHGPSGELSRFAHDELNLATAGANLGWPTLDACETRAGLVTPLLTFSNAVPPGGVAVYRGDAIPEWKGSVLFSALAAEHLHRVVLENGRVKAHETYFLRKFGRLRDVEMGPDNQLYVTTSNCDGRGQCPAQKDRVLRITRH